MESQSAGPALNSIKVAVLGNPTVGKKSFIDKLGRKQNQNLFSLLESKDKNYQTNIHLESNLGPCQISFVNIELDLQRMQQDSEYKRQIQTTLFQCDCGIFMFSLADRQSYKDIPAYFREWSRVKQNSYSVLVGTKVDLQDIKIKQRQITYHRKKNMQLYNISTKACYTIMKPIQYLMRRKIGNMALNFSNISDFVDLSNEVQFKRLQEFEKELKQLHLDPPLMLDWEAQN